MHKVDREMILVTGATGFIGRHIFNHLDNLGYVVVGISKNGGKVGKRKIRKLDLGDGKQICCLFKQLPIRAVIHAAALTLKGQDGDHEKILRTNVLGTYLILEQCVLGSVKRFIYFSSASVYSRSGVLFRTPETAVAPAGFYGVTKLAGEDVLLSFPKSKIQMLSLRLASVFGPGQRKDSVLPIFLGKALKNEALMIDGKGWRSQDFVYIKDVIQAIMLSLKTKTTGTFNIGSGRETSLFSLAKTIIKATGSESPIVLSNSAGADESRFSLNIDLARKKLGYNPKYSLLTGLKDYLSAEAFQQK